MANVERPIVDVQFVIWLCAAVMLVEILLIWVSVKDLVINEDAWWNWLYALLAIVALCCVGLIKAIVDKAANKRRELDRILSLIMPALFLFVYNATPSSGGEIYTYTYRLFYSDSPCRFQYLQLTSSATSVVGYLLYGSVCNRRRIRSVFLVTTLSAALAGLLWIPLSNASLEADCVLLGTGPRHGHTPCMDKYTYAVLTTVVAGLFGTFATAPSTVLATESSPKEQKTIAYAVFLSIIDSGASASGWITAPIVRHLGIDYLTDDWGGLSTLIWICTFSQVGVLLLLPLVRNLKDGGTKAKTEDDEEAQLQQEERDEDQGGRV